MIKQIKEIDFKKLKRISPSQLTALRNCGYKSLLAEAFGRKPLLPGSPQSFFGSILHVMIELILKKRIVNEQEFNVRFQQAIAEKEEELSKLGFGFLIPFQKSVRNYGLQKGLVKTLLSNNGNNNERPQGSTFFSEKWVESLDGIIGGRIDLVIDDGNEIHIIDFKTGSIKEESLDDEGEAFFDIKREYKDQLKLYAYLYFELTGKFPSRLSIIDLARQIYNIDFTKNECKIIYDEAKAIFQKLNQKVENQMFEANPSENNCKYCLYRPACDFYIGYLKLNNHFNDVVGTVTEVMKYGNGNVTVFIETNGSAFSVTKIPVAYYDILNNRKSSVIGVFNLRKDPTGLIFSATKNTVIYDRT